MGASSRAGGNCPATARASKQSDAARHEQGDKPGFVRLVGAASGRSDEDFDSGALSRVSASAINSRRMASAHTHIVWRGDSHYGRVEGDGMGGRQRHRLHFRSRWRVYRGAPPRGLRCRRGVTPLDVPPLRQDDAGGTNWREALPAWWRSALGATVGARQPARSMNGAIKRLRPTFAKGLGGCRLDAHAQASCAGRCCKRVRASVQ